MPKHGIYVTQQSTSLATPVVATSGIPFFIGTAPLDEAENAAAVGEPVLCTDYSEAEDKLGYNEDWDTYTLCEAMYSHFKVFSCQPAIFLPVSKEKLDPSEGAAQIVAAIESVELCLTKFGIVPDLIVAPGYSQESTVAAAMAAKAPVINGMFRGKAIVDLEADSYTAAIEKKGEGSFTEDQIVCWPMCQLGKMKFHLSTLVAGRLAATDTDNAGVPYESPSNKTIMMDGLIDNTGKAVNLTKNQADLLVNQGIVTSINFMTGGFVVWGNYTACYPTNTDVKDYFIPLSRMFDWVNNTIIQTFWGKLDKPMNRRLIDSILDTCNIWMNGLVGGGYLLGARVEMNDAENPVTDLMAGIVRFHVYMTPPSPMQEADFILEYDPSYVTAAFGG